MPKSVEGPASVSFEHVSFSYPTADEVSLASLESIASLDQRPSGEVLHDVTFSVAAGQTVALVGRSGGGKTTMTHLIARLYDATSGTVSVAGTDVKKLKQDSLRAAVGYVTQDAHMFHDTIRANLELRPPRRHRGRALGSAGGRTAQDAGARACPTGSTRWSASAATGSPVANGSVWRIARLLLKAPPIVVLDEATAHLDSESEVAVQQALDRAMEGRTSIVIAHRLSTVRNADLIVVVDHGRIVQRGRHDECCWPSGGLYAELYHTQFDQSPRWAPPSTGITEPVR